jgi:hypothetical protein
MPTFTSQGETSNIEGESSNHEGERSNVEDAPSKNFGDGATAAVSPANS